MFFAVAAPREDGLSSSVEKLTADVTARTSVARSSLDDRDGSQPCSSYAIRGS